MRRLAIALAVALLGVAAPAVDRHPSFDGPFLVRYGVAEGPDGRTTDSKTYEDLMRAGACGLNSHARVWPDEHVITLVCEL